ncbi:hypothetical protein ACE1SV_34560 [Streptomyces sennicomposti]
MRGGRAFGGGTRRRHAPTGGHREASAGIGRRRGVRVTGLSGTGGRRGPTVLRSPGFPVLTWGSASVAAVHGAVRRTGYCMIRKFERRLGNSVLIPVVVSIGCGAPEESSQDPEF